MIINDFESSHEETLNLLKYNNNYIFLLSNDVSKYSIKDKFPTQMLVLGIKNNNFKNAMNLTLEYKANITILINDDIMVFDPLGNIFYLTFFSLGKKFRWQEYAHLYGALAP